MRMPRDWLESRLASTVSRLLVGIMNASVAVNFIVNGNDAEVIADEAPRRFGAAGVGRSFSSSQRAPRT